MAYIEDVADATKRNTFFRKVLATGEHSQVVAMCLQPKEDIGEEVHPHVDQILVLVGGTADAVIEGKRTPVGPGWLVQVPAGARHNIVNTGSADLRLYTVYSPPQHAPGTIHRTKADAEAAEAAEHKH